MKRIETKNTSSLPVGRDGTACDSAAAPVTECRALALITPAPGQRREIARPHPSLPFLAQLLAAKDQLPQSRERRREEPEVAMHVYELGMTPVPAAHGRLFSRAM